MHTANPKHRPATPLTWLRRVIGVGVLGTLAMIALQGLATCAELKSHPVAPGRVGEVASPAIHLAGPRVGERLDPEYENAVETADRLSTAFRKAASRVLPAVVSIETRMATPTHPYTSEMGETSGIGSGVIVDATGVILTNNHVVMGGRGHVTVRLQDGREYPARAIYTDPQTDIAVVQISAPADLQSARLGDSDRVRIGDWVLALGQPFGLESTVTAGIISAKDRGIGITDRENFLQTDAAINPGNSGGPLINLRGEVVGINTAITSRSGGNNGIAFSVPINLARWVADQLLAHGTVHRALLGIEVQPLDFALARKLGASGNRGVVVTGVKPNTPAWNSGLQPGDVIVAINDQAVKNANQFQLVVERVQPGQPQLLDILRQGQARTVRIRPAERPIDRRTSYRPAVRTDPFQNELGLRIGSIHGQIAQQIGVPQNETGALVVGVSPGSIADRAGLRPGMIIQRIEQHPVRSVQDVVRQFETADLDQGVLVFVKSPTGSRFLVLQSN